MTMSRRAAAVLPLGILLALSMLAGCRQLQNALLFYPQPLARTVPAPPAGWSVEPLAVERPANVTLRGWLIVPPRLPARAVIYFGGNAEEVSWLIPNADKFGGRAVALVNYRGFGQSDGRPDEAALTGDALALFDMLAARQDVDPAGIAVMGRSLGTGIAVGLASQRAVDRAVLVSPYDSIEAVGGHHFPAALVRAVIADRYDAKSMAPKLRIPLIAIVAGRDDIIPQVRSQSLYDAWGGPKRWIAFGRAGHNDLQAFPEFWRDIGAFLAGP